MYDATIILAAIVICCVLACIIYGIAYLTWHCSFQRKPAPPEPKLITICDTCAYQLFCKLDYCPWKDIENSPPPARSGLSDGK